MILYHNYYSDKCNFCNFSAHPHNKNTLMDKKIIVPFINQEPEDGKIPENATTIQIGTNNWPKDFPYSPSVKASLWHNGSFFFINYEVDEKYIAAMASKDNGEVWKDSCAEFFVALDDKGYYNIEANCIGNILMSHRKSRKENVEYADEKILNNISRTSSLVAKPFKARPSTQPWTLRLAIPASAFFKHKLESFNGVEARCNFYKCGDDLPEPHFLSFNPIKTETPDFHRPEFFADIYFNS